jgi:hypothetical protein
MHQGSGEIMSNLNSRRAELEEERLRLQEEINQYPSPIPCCDVYFNDLLERRSRASEQLTKLTRSTVAQPTLRAFSDT